MHYRVLIGVVLLSCAALAFWLVRERLGGQEQTTFLHWQEPRIVAEGAALYRTHCASCHAIADASMPAVPPEEQDTPPHDASGHTWQHPDYALFQLVRDGVAAGNLTPPDPERKPSLRDTVAVSQPVMAVLVTAIARKHLKPPRKLLIAGDLFNMDGFSKYDQIGKLGTRCVGKRPAKGHRIASSTGCRRSIITLAVFFFPFAYHVVKR